jgi:hypothetical protein
MLRPDGIFEGIGNRHLPYYRIEGSRPVFSRRNNEVFGFHNGLHFINHSIKNNYMFAK